MPRRDYAMVTVEVVRTRTFLESSSGTSLLANLGRVLEGTAFATNHEMMVALAFRTHLDDIERDVGLQANVLECLPMGVIEFANQ